MRLFEQQPPRLKSRQSHGFEFAFDINRDMSASDSIRSKWAFYIALTLAADSNPLGNSLGVMIIDEPRQQETELGSVQAFYEALSEAARACQVIVASSASSADLDELLRGSSANRIRSDATHMFSDEALG